MRDRLLHEFHAIRRLIYSALFRRFYGKRLGGIKREFHQMYYDSWVFEGTWKNTYWLGVPTYKCPLDLWVYQEILHKQRPDVIIETGTANGGSGLYLATMCDVIGHGQVVTIDIEHRADLPQHERLRYLLGSSTAPEILDEVRSILADADAERVLVILDSDHRRAHVLDELRAYSGFVNDGSYLVVEDTHVNGHPIEPAHGPGPMEALDEFLRETDEFVIDESCEKFYMTFNPRGYLRRVKPVAASAAEPRRDGELALSQSS
jgi:cephalosporin hydroxylase